jgi:hypothetical protein
MVTIALHLDVQEQQNYTAQQIEEDQRKNNFVQVIKSLCHTRNCINGLNCTIIPYCGEWSEVWKHVIACKDAKCVFPQCLTSKTVLAHFQHCPRKDECEYCSVAVRDIVKTRCVERKESLKRKRSEELSNCGDNVSCGNQELSVDQQKSLCKSSIDDINERDLKTPLSNNGSIDEKEAVIGTPRNKFRKTGFTAPLVPAENEKRNDEKGREVIIEQHKKLLNHSISCRAIDCPSKNCQKMKELITHHKQCNVDNCQLCRRINNLYFLHNKACPYKGSTCPLEKCQEFTAAKKKTVFISSFVACGNLNVPPLSSLKIEG